MSENYFYWFANLRMSFNVRSNHANTHSASLAEAGQDTHKQRETDGLKDEL